jgi:hypothetical protein
MFPSPFSDVLEGAGLGRVHPNSLNEGHCLIVVDLVCLRSICTETLAWR